MKALSLMDPWGTFVALGYKQNETRSWRTQYVGDLAIHVSKSREGIRPNYVHELCLRAMLSPGQFRNYPWPLGKIVAVVRLIYCIPTEECTDLSTRERELGNYAPKRFAFGLGELRRLRDPIGCPGSLGLWTVPPEIEARVHMQVAA